ncbi:MAG TPA: drug:proton antiporter, partial [Firmicutes bacterium]|nr:drug:proton antiporter [Bacillota bacterium]
MASFGASLDKIQWIVTAYMVIFAVMLPTSGWLADHFGYKRIYFTALLLFTTGSFLCGISWNENALIFFRIIQGTGAGLLMPVGMAIVTREFPMEQRSLALGFWSIAAAASVSLGPMIGGYLIDHISWQAIFDINVPVGLFGMFATFIIQREYKSEQARSFDLMGFISMAIFLSTLLIALDDAHAAWNTGGWTAPFILVCFGLSFFCFVIFVVTELTVAHPLIDLRLLKNFNFGFANLVLFIFGLGMFGSTFVLPLYLQNSLGYTAFQAGLVFLPVGLIQAFISPICGFMVAKINPKIFAAVGIVLMAFSMYLNSFQSLYSEHSQIMLPLIIRAFGMGMMFTPLTTISLSEIGRENIAQASGMLNIIRQVGGSFGVAILSTILTQRTTFHTTIYSQSVALTSPTTVRTLQGFQSFIQHQVGGPIFNYQLQVYNVTMQAISVIGQHLANQAFVHAVNDVFLTTSIITLSGIIPIFLLRYHIKKKEN